MNKNKQTLEKLFPVEINLTYDDLLVAKYDIARVTDENMSAIAGEIADNLMEGYWLSLTAIASRRGLARASGRATFHCYNCGDDLECGAIRYNAGRKFCDDCINGITKYSS